MLKRNRLESWPAKKRVIRLKKKVRKMTFEEELKGLINKHRKENDPDTLDFILAEYLLECLRDFSKAERSIKGVAIWKK